MEDVLNPGSSIAVEFRVSELAAGREKPSSALDDHRVGGSSESYSFGNFELNQPERGSHGRVSVLSSIDELRL